jgi:phosphatidylinositol kinase/protein kinase (PI-3  family)
MNAPPTAPDEFYQTVTINALVNVLADPTLTNNHWSATEAVMLIFTTQGLKCVPYLGQVSNTLVTCRFVTKTLCRSSLRFWGWSA